MKPNKEPFQIYNYFSLIFFVKKITKLWDKRNHVKFTLVFSFFSKLFNQKITKFCAYETKQGTMSNLHYLFLFSKKFTNCFVKKVQIFVGRKPNNAPCQIYFFFFLNFPKFSQTFFVKKKFNLFSAKETLVESSDLFFLKFSDACYYWLTSQERI
jgi:hypothetical protein